MKSIIEEQKLDQISEKLKDFFSTAEEVARRTKFVQRKSAVGGALFLKAIVFGFLRKATASLNTIAQEIARLGVKITPQGVDERINEYTVKFMKAMYLEAFEQFKNKLALPLPILQQFISIFLVDSTFKELPANMAEMYPGSGGKASTASLKIQLVFEFLFGNLTQLVIEPGRAADQSYIQYLEVVKAGSLVIMDLGYYRLASFLSIAEMGAFFLSRYQYGTCVSSSDGSKIDLLTWMPAQNQKVLDLHVLVGANPRKQIACRLVATPVPLAVAEERRRKAKLSAAKRGRILSDDYLAFLSWTIFLTNVPETMLSASQVTQFYRIRWQIELVFKFWKSYCGLATLSAFRPERIFTELFAKLFSAVIVNFLIVPLRIPDEVWADREISPFQIHNILSTFAQEMMLALSHPDIWSKTLHDLYQHIQDFGFKQRRRTKPNICAWLAVMQPVVPS